MNLLGKLFGGQQFIPGMSLDDRIKMMQRQQLMSQQQLAKAGSNVKTGAGLGALILAKLMGAGGNPQLQQLYAQKAEEDKKQTELFNEALRNNDYSKLIANTNDPKLRRNLIMQRLKSQGSGGLSSGIGKIINDRNKLLKRKAELKAQGKDTAQVDYNLKLLEQRLTNKAASKGGVNVEIQNNIKNLPKTKIPVGQRPIPMTDAKGNIIYDKAGRPVISHTEPVAGAKPKTAEQASKTSSTAQSIKIITELLEGGEIKNSKTGKIYKLPGIYNKDGSINRQLVGEIQFNVWGRPGRTHRSRISEAIQVKLRNETGAAAPEHEVKNILDRYLPQVQDMDATIVDKMKRFRQLMSSNLALSAPDLYRQIRRTQLKGSGKSKLDIQKQINAEIRAGGFKEYSGVKEAKKKASAGKTKFDGNQKALDIRRRFKAGEITREQAKALLNNL